MEKIMDKQKKGKCKEAYLSVARLWTWYARKKKGPLLD
jgi:hypothetical protein